MAARRLRSLHGAIRRIEGCPRLVRVPLLLVAFTLGSSLSATVGWTLLEVSHLVRSALTGRELFWGGLAGPLFLVLHAWLTNAPATIVFVVGSCSAAVVGYSLAERDADAWSAGFAFLISWVTYAFGGALIVLFLLEEAFGKEYGWLLSLTLLSFVLAPIFGGLGLAFAAAAPLLYVRAKRLAWQSTRAAPRPAVVAAGRYMVEMEVRVDATPDRTQAAPRKDASRPRRIRQARRRSR